MSESVFSSRLVSHQDLQQIPEIIASGTSVDYRRAPSEFPANQAWGLTLLLSGGSGAGSVLSVAGTPDGAGFLFALTAAQTAALTIGNYLWEERADKAGKKYTFDSGVLQILANLAGATPIVTFAAKALAAIEAALTIRLGIGASAPQDVVERYAIGIRQFDKWSTREMLGEQARLEKIVRGQANPGRLGPTFAVRFGSAEEEPELWH